MKRCVSTTDVGTCTNWLTFEPDPDYNPDAGTGLLSPLSYKLSVAEFYIGENSTYACWRGPTLQRRVGLEWFYSVNRQNNFVGGTCAPRIARLVYFVNVMKQLCNTWPNTTQHDTLHRKYLKMFVLRMQSTPPVGNPCKYLWDLLIQSFWSPTYQLA